LVGEDEKDVDVGGICTGAGCSSDVRSLVKQ